MINYLDRLESGPSGFMAYGDLWGFAWHDSFITRGLSVTLGVSINPHKSKHRFIINQGVADLWVMGINFLPL